MIRITTQTTPGMNSELAIEYHEMKKTLNKALSKPSQKSLELIKQYAQASSK